MLRVVYDGKNYFGSEEELAEMDIPDELIKQALSNIKPINNKRQLQSIICQAFLGEDAPTDAKTMLALSLVGKASNALSAALNIHMQVYQRLANAQSLADVRAAVEPAMPLMQRVAQMLEAGELLSVQHAQDITDEDAVIEGLEAMTKAAKVIQQATPA